MNILKIGLVAAVLWQSSLVYAEVDTEVNELPPPAVRQLCEEIIASGNSVLEYLNGGTPGAITNTFGIGSNEWYMIRGVERGLEDVVVHPDFLFFLKYRYGNGDIIGVELDVNSDHLSKAASLMNGNFKNIAMPFKRLPYPIPKSWKNNLKSLSAPGLKHVRRSALGGTSSDYYKIRSVDLSSAESIENGAFYFCINLNSLKLSNALKFVNDETFYGNRVFSANIPHFTHFLSNLAFRPYSSGYLALLSTSDLLRFSSNPFQYASTVTLNVTCYSRINNIRKLLDKINSSISTANFKNLNIKIADSIKHIANVDYINEILAMNKGSNLLNRVANYGRAFLDFSNTEISETDLCYIEKTGDLSWGLSLPHIATVDASFNGLFQQLHGVILDTGLVREGAFDECSGLTTLGFRNTTVFEGTPLAELTPSILELTVTQPQNVPCFLSALEVAGLDLSSIEQFIIKIPDAEAQSANLGPYVASLLAVLPGPPQISQEIQHFQVLMAFFTLI